MIIVNITILIITTIFVIYYSLSMKKPYPKTLLTYFDMPHIRFAVYVLLYIVSYYNYIIGLVSLIAILLLNVDYINLYVK